MTDVSALRQHAPVFLRAIAEQSSDPDGCLVMTVDAFPEPELLAAALRYAYDCGVTVVMAPNREVTATNTTKG